jgi:peptide/nickel transport system ATP-binding protein
LQPLLQIKNLSVDFKTSSETTSAIKNISLEVNQEEIVAIVGESGSGKTVTSLSILQLLPVPPAIYQSGEILFSNNGISQVDLLRSSGEELRNIRGNEIAMIFQEPMTSLSPVQTCGSQIMEAIKLHQRLKASVAKQKTLELFRQVDLPEPSIIMNRYPHQLSGGQKQRVMIAMAMSCKPSLLIADEPTTALDVVVQKTILQLIKNLQQQYHMGVIYITHDLGLVAEIANRVIVMYKGNIVETGSVKKIFLDAEHPYTKALLACRPTLHTKKQRLPVVSDFMDDQTLTPEGQKSTVSNKNNYLPADKVSDEKELLCQQKTLIEVKNLKVYFPIRKDFFGKTVRQFKAVDNVSFTIQEGETVGLVGESGCGKTTLGRTLLRLIEPTSGNIFFAGRDIAHIPKDEMRRMRKKIQIIFQDPYGSLNPRITVGSAIQEPLKVHGLLQSDSRRKQKVLELLNKVNLRSEHFNRYPHEFSGGQRQRICIARALALNPDFLICDESVSALDVSVQAQVLNLLNDLKKEFGFTSIFISHDIGVVRYVSDRIMVMSTGQIVETGPAEDICLHPQNEYTRKLISSMPKGLAT